MSDDKLERITQAIYDAPLSVSGDTLAELILDSEWVVPPMIDESRKPVIEQVKDICREVAQHVLKELEK